MSRKPLITLILAEAAALLGTRLSMIAVPWLVLTQLGDPLLAGIVAFAELAPYVVAKAAGGPLIDRLGGRRVSVAADLASVPVLLAIPLLHAGGWLQPVVLMALMALLGTLRGPADAAKYAMVPEVAAAGGVPLSRVTGLVSSVERLASTLGAGLAAGLVALVGPADALVATAALVAAAALVVAFGLRVRTRPEPETEAETEPAGYLAQLRSGWRHLRGDEVLLAITLMVAVTNLLDQGMAVVLMPVWAEQSGGIGWLGTAQVAFAGGAVAGSLTASAIAERLPRLPTYVFAYTLCALPKFALFALPLPLWGLALGVAAAGFAAGFINPIIGALVFERVPARLTGRVTALFGATAWSLMPLGGLLAGALVSWLGLTPALLIFGAVYSAATLSPLVIGSFRQMNGAGAAAHAARTEPTAHAA